jgi:hypothetical protein
MQEIHEIIKGLEAIEFLVIKVTVVTGVVVFCARKLWAEIKHKRKSKRKRKRKKKRKKRKSKPKKPD